VLPENELISIGVIVNAHGIKGELRVKPLAHEPELLVGSKVYFKLRGEYQIHSVERARLRGNNLILKLNGINDRNSAEELKGVFIEKQQIELRPLDKDEYMVLDLIGLQVQTFNGQNIGKLINVLSLPANDVYVLTDGEREFLIPAIKDVVKKIDLQQRIMIIDPIEGLLD